MKIPIKRKVPTSLSIDPKHKPKYKTVEKEIEIKDELLMKYIALIDELFDRTWDELENRSWAKVVVPLVPFPFFEKYREPENTDSGSWIVFWLVTTLRDNIFERAEIVNTLFELGGIEEIEKDPIVNLETGQLSGTEFVVSINRDELRVIKKKILAEFDKQQQNSGARSIDLTDLDFHQALYLLRAVYNKVIEILEAVCNGPIMQNDVRLNFSYTILLQAVQDILAMKGFEELQEDMPELLDSLVGDLSEADSEWEYGYGPASRNFFAKIEKLYIKSGARVSELPRSADLSLSEADEALKEHRKQKRGTWNRVLTDIDERKKRGEFSFDGLSGEPEMTVPETFTISVKDREIWINDFFLSKPHAGGDNKYFFDHIYRQPNESISWAQLPKIVQDAIGKKSFLKILNELGFKSQILKAFYPERSKDSLLFRPMVTTANLQKDGIKISLLMQELRTAHAKNSPE